MKRRRPYEELTDPKNERVNATLTPRAWARLVSLSARAAFYDSNVLEGVIHEARQTSGSIKGEHRRDLVEAIKNPTLAPNGAALQQPPVAHDQYGQPAPEAADPGGEAAL